MSATAPDRDALLSRLAEIAREVTDIAVELGATCCEVSGNNQGLVAPFPLITLHGAPWAPARYWRTLHVPGSDVHPDRDCEVGDGTIDGVRISAFRDVQPAAVAERSPS